MKIRAAVFFALTGLPCYLKAQTTAPVDPRPKTAVESPADQSRRLQVEAATSGGVSSLKTQVRGLPISPGRTVGDLVDATHSDIELEKALRSATAVGGPRWGDDQSCQIRVDLPGRAVTALVSAISRDHPAAVGNGSEQLQRRIEEWNRTTFTTVGVSVGGDKIDEAASPAHGGGWAGVNEADRRAAVAAARRDAVQQFVDRMKTAGDGTGGSVAGLFDRPKVNERVVEWLTRQPVTRIEFGGDRRVSVTVSVSTKTLSEVLESAVKDSPGAAVDWRRVGPAIKGLPATAVGTATAPAGGATTRAGPFATPLPANPIEGFDKPLQAEATVHSTGNPLKTARAAEAAAGVKVREAFLALHVTKEKTLAAAVADDPRLPSRVDHALLGAKAYRVDYMPDGSVTVKVNLDVKAAWNEICTTR